MDPRPCDRGFGDVRPKKRLMRLVESLTPEPGVSFLRATSSTSDRYRTALDKAGWSKCGLFITQFVTALSLYACTANIAAVPDSTSTQSQGVVPKGIIESVRRRWFSNAQFACTSMVDSCLDMDRFFHNDKATLIDDCVGIVNNDSGNFSGITQFMLFMTGIARRSADGSRYWTACQPVFFDITMAFSQQLYSWDCYKYCEPENLQHEHVQQLVNIGRGKHVLRRKDIINPKSPNQSFAELEDEFSGAFYTSEITSEDGQRAILLDWSRIPQVERDYILADIAAQSRTRAALLSPDTSQFVLSPFYIDWDGVGEWFNAPGWTGLPRWQEGALVGVVIIGGAAVFLFCTGTAGACMLAAPVIAAAASR